MSMYNDYTIQIIHDEKVAGYRAEAANDRLVRIANGMRQPWWRRLWDGPKRAPLDRAPLDRAADWYRYPQVRRHGLKPGKQHVARS